MERVEHTYITPADIDAVWAYFINPASLAELEPEHHQLQLIDTDLPAEAYSGLHVHYHLSPIPGITLNIDNLFSEIEPKHFYATEIVNGLFDYWRFEHFFRPVATGGTEIRNIVFFKPIVGQLGDKIDMVFTRKEIMAIFKHRENITRKKWG